MGNALNNASSTSDFRLQTPYIEYTNPYWPIIEFNLCTYRSTFFNKSKSLLRLWLL